MSFHFTVESQQQQHQHQQKQQQQQLQPRKGNSGMPQLPSKNPIRKLYSLVAKIL